MDYILFLAESCFAMTEFEGLYAMTEFEAGCDALNMQTFFPPCGARLVVAGGLSTPKRWGKPRAPCGTGFEQTRKGRP